MKSSKEYKKRTEEVYALLNTIPHGKVTTYKALAKHFKTSPRHIGKILSMNERPEKYRCFLVIRSNRNTGGYTINGKSNERSRLLKIKKLKHWGIAIKKEKVDPSCILNDTKQWLKA